MRTAIRHDQKKRKWGLGFVRWLLPTSNSYGTGLRLYKLTISLVQRNTRSGTVAAIFDADQRVSAAPCDGRRSYSAEPP